MHITGTTVVHFTVGDPVAQVRAPEVMNQVFEAAGIDAVVVPARVAPDHIEAFVRAALSSPSVQGFFVAIPHKAPLLQMAARATSAARIAGATNALGRGPQGELVADLFDGEGFLRAVAHFGIRVAGKSVLIVGAGGAACAIGSALATAGAGSIEFCDSVPGKADAAVRLLGRNFAVHAAVQERPEASGKYLVVNATPMGLNPGDPLPLDVTQLDAGAALVDIIMTPRPTPLIQLARKRGLKAFSGHEMFVQQVPLYLRFFGYQELSAQLERDLSSVRRTLMPEAEPQ